MNNPGSPAAMHRVTLNLDMDVSCASVEQRDEPALCPRDLTLTPFRKAHPLQIVPCSVSLALNAGLSRIDALDREGKAPLKFSNNLTCTG